MGYDMTVRDGSKIDPDLLKMAEEHQAKWRKLIDERDAFEKGTSERIAIQDAINELGYPEDPGYFRLNIGGMGRYREYMERFNMLHWEEAGIPDWNHAVDGEDYDKIYDEGGRDAYLSAVYANEPRLVWSPEIPGMAGWKFCSNDSWLVNPIEIRSALNAYAEVPIGDVVEVVGQDSVEYWIKWVNFLERAANCGGFIQG